MSPDIEHELRDYLRAQKEADQAGTLRRMADWCTQHDADDRVRHQEILGAIKGHSLRIGALEKADAKLEDRVEQSGSWEREALQAQAHQARESKTWMGRQWLGWVVGGVAAVAMLAINTLVAWAMKGK